MPLSEDDQDLVEVVIACTNGQIGRSAAVEIIEQLDLAGFEIVRRTDVRETLLAVENERLRAAILSYAVHHGNCVGSAHCTCGLQELIDDLTN